MSKRKYPLRNLQRRLNQGTTILVLGIGAIALGTIFSDPGRYQAPPLVGERALASIETSEQGKPEPIKTTSILSLDCSDKTEAVSLTQQIRLRGRVCENDQAKIVSSQIENTRNGYVATVFHQDKDFTTDFIQLSEGKNQLIVKHTLSDGKVEEHQILVTRKDE